MDCNTSYYTKQLCKYCGKEIKIDAIDFLMNLEQPIICDDCLNDPINKERE